MPQVQKWNSGVEGLLVFDSISKTHMKPSPCILIVNKFLVTHKLL